MVVVLLVLSFHQPAVLTSQGFALIGTKALWGGPIGLRRALSPPWMYQVYEWSNENKISRKPGT
jgi:hypothetical protein